MALGKQVSEFSMKATSSTITAGPGTAMTFQTNYEGTAKGEAGDGSVFGTLTVVAESGAKGGGWKWTGALFSKDGGGVGDNSQGTWHESGPNKWRYRGSGQNSEGRVYAVESDQDLATRTITGKLYDWN